MMKRGNLWRELRRRYKRVRCSNWMSETYYSKCFRNMLLKGGNCENALNYPQI